MRREAADLRIFVYIASNKKQACKRRRFSAGAGKTEQFGPQKFRFCSGKNGAGKISFFLPAPAVPAVPFPKFKISEKISVKMVRLFTFISIQSIFRNYFNCDDIIKDQFMTENEIFSKNARKIFKTANSGGKT